ncbi:MAG: pyridoxamine 5'-phosphate oxidase family protein [Candidatus Binatus sp.]|uniref:pyridoxamine 5'-phosphate oxidase family protein n=1 Tax=Candidatus Binatus sp. TaxID=2811406 RepID=UPI0027213DCF|nr:pyridoxamine 5'-phosphate oxidase family protein [Candidatus Binatus sp.]MDO8432353.1 pyridoxamine 5'-phosphate oxidase family protein [Candidatus Binatus sp.]
MEATIKSTMADNAEVRATPRTRVKRLPKRAAYDRASINSILDNALVCHVGFALDGQPYVIPTLHARIGETLYIHGSAASRLLGAAAAGAPICVTVTHIDGLVLARSAFHHSVNYRSAVILGAASLVTGEASKLAAMRGLIDHVAPGRWEHIRQPNSKELAATSVLSIPITEASAKIRTGPAIDDEADYALPIWAGEISLAISARAPIADARVAQSISMPPHVREYRLPGARTGQGVEPSCIDPTQR